MSILRRIAAPFAKPLGDYMERWIFRTPWFAVRLHHILRSDADRHFHDHPFDFHSLLLSGGYTEHTPAGTKRWPRFSIVRRRAEDLHRLQLERPVRTLVLAGRKRREWGFATELGWVHWSSYCEKYPEEAGSI